MLESLLFDFADGGIGGMALFALASGLSVVFFFPGSVVMTGGLTAPLPLPPGGWVQARLDLADGLVVEVRVERRDP
jgi:hypothetical protein